MPPGSALAEKSCGQSPNQGRSPLPIFQLNGGAQPRLTSGGIAAVPHPVIFGAAPSV